MIIDYLIYVWQFLTLTTVVLLLIDVIVCTFVGHKFDKNDWIGTVIILIGAFLPIVQVLLMIWLVIDIRREWKKDRGEF